MQVCVFPADKWGCGHYRLIWPAEALIAQGYDVRVVLPGEASGLHGSWNNNRLEGVMIDNDADVFVFQRPTSAALSQLIEHLVNDGRTVVVDMDDDLTNIHPDNLAFRLLHPKLSPINNWQPTDFPAVFQQAYIDDDGRELTADINLADTDTSVMARRLASIELERARLTRQISIECNIEALRAQAGLPVLFHFPELGYNHQPMDVLEWGLSIEGRDVRLPVTLRETSAAVYNEPEEVVVTPWTPPVVPPMFYRRPICLRHPSYIAINSPLFLLAAAPGDDVIRSRLLWGKTESGDFETVGMIPSFALPLSLEAAIGLTTSTVRVKLLPLSGEGADPRRQLSLLTDWDGDSGDANRDAMLLIVLSKAGGQVVVSEVMSVNGPAASVSTDVYDLTVLRGRRQSGIHAFDAGSFPDAFSSYEAWLIPLTGLRPFDRPDWIATPPTLARMSIWLRYTPLGLSLPYEGPKAYVEYQRRVAAPEDLQEFEHQISAVHQPTDYFVWPVFTSGPPNYIDLWPPAPGIDAYHREVGGTASLCGFDEFGTASSPPKKYRRKTYTGGTVVCVKTGYDCSGGDAGVHKWEFFSGYAEYGSSTCTIDTNTGLANGLASPVGTGVYTCGTGIPYSNTIDPAGLVSTRNYYGTGVVGLTQTKTVSQQIPTGDCITGLFDWGFRASQADAADTLSLEDTEETAGARLSASLGGFGAFENCSVFFPCGLSRWQIRTSGFSFDYYIGQFQLTGDDFVAAASYLVEVHFIRTHIATSVVDYFTLYYDTTADGAGHLELTFDMPLERGFQIQVLDLPVVRSKPVPVGPVIETET